MFFEVDELIDTADFSYVFSAEENIQNAPVPSLQQQNATMELKSYRKSACTSIGKYTNIEQLFVLYKHRRWYKCRLTFTNAQHQAAIQMKLVFANYDKPVKVPESLCNVVVKDLTWKDDHVCKCNVQFLMSTYRLGLVQIAFQDEDLLFPENRGIKILARAE